MPSPSQLRRAKRDLEAQQQRELAALEVTEEELAVIRDEQMSLSIAKHLAAHLGPPASRQRPRPKVVRPASKQRH